MTKKYAKSFDEYFTLNGYASNIYKETKDTKPTNKKNKNKLIRKL